MINPLHISVFCGLFCVLNVICSLSTQRVLRGRPTSGPPGLCGPVTGRPQLLLAFHLTCTRNKAATLPMQVAEERLKATGILFSFVTTQDI